MRWSQAFIPTLRDDPADADAASHRLLVRGGFVRQLMSGVYSLLPLAVRVRDKVGNIIREEMNAIGAQEFLLPTLHPGELWRESGRWETMDDIMFRLKDRRDADVVLSITHEEVFATLATEMASYRELPQIWYHVQTKYRDEPRPKGGLLRTREFTMKDSYTFDIDEAGLDTGFDKNHGAYRKIFARLGLDALDVAASSGAMGGTVSIEFVVRSDAGEDLIAHCPNCDYRANIERATSVVETVDDESGPAAPEEFATPGVRTIQHLVDDYDVPADRQVKTMVYLLDGVLTLVLLRGDHSLVEQKLMDGTGAIEVRPANPDEVREALGALPGSLGAVGVTSHKVYADHALSGRRSMVTGANRDDIHFRGVDVGRDIEVAEWLDLRGVAAGEQCPECGTALEVFKAIEVGHIFKLGRVFAEAFGAQVLDEGGETRTIIMGSYGIGLERNMAAVVEAHHDDDGIAWPVTVAPYEVVITVLNPDQTLAAAEKLYEALLADDIEVLLDDRAERPGVKFKDADLIGFPYRVTIGPRGLAAGTVEVRRRADGETYEVGLDAAAGVVAERVRAER